MKILFIIDNLTSGGKERQLVYLLRKLSEDQNIQLIVFNEDIFYKEILDLPITIKVIKQNSKYSIKNLKIIYETIKNFQTTFIHSWSNYITLLVFPFLIFHPKIKLISSIRYAGKLKKSIKSSLIKRLTWLRSSFIVSNSKQGLLVEKLNNNIKGKVIYNGLDIKKFDEESYNLNSNLPCKKFPSVVLMIASFSPAKDYLTFVKTAKMISEKNKNVCFLCIGDGPNRMKAEQESGKYFNKTIFFPGRRNDIPAIIKKSKIGVLLNNTNGHAEGISNAIMEYMAAELPVIATNAGGTPELVQDGISGFLVPAFNENVVAEKILYLINNPGKAREMGKRGREIIENEFSIEKMSSSYLELYKRLTNEL